MESVVHNVRDLNEKQRNAAQQLVGHELRDNQQLRIQVSDPIDDTRLVRSERNSWPCKAGSAKDKILWIAPDFDNPLEEFKEYME